MKFFYRPNLFSKGLISLLAAFSPKKTWSSSKGIRQSNKNLSFIFLFQISLFLSHDY